MSKVDSMNFGRYDFKITLPIFIFYCKTWDSVDEHSAYINQKLIKIDNYCKL